MLPLPVVSYQPGLWHDDQLDPEVREDELELAQPFLVGDDGLVEGEGLRVEPAPGPGLADARSVDREVDRDLERGEHLLPDHFAAFLPGAEPVAVDDRAAVHDEAAAGERDEVLDVAVGADRGDRGLDVVDPHAVCFERLVVLVELRLEPSEVGVAGCARVVVLPLARVLGPGLVLGRAGDEHLAQRPDPLGAPAAPPDLLDLVVEVGFVEHVVAKRLARLEPRKGLEDARARHGSRPAAVTSNRARPSFRPPCGLETELSLERTYRSSAASWLPSSLPVW